MSRHRKGLASINPGMLQHVSIALRSVAAQPVANLEEMDQKQVSRRFQVFKELITTERDFLNDINITIEDIMNPLLEHEVC